MRYAVLILTLLVSQVHADAKIKMDFKNEDIVKVIETYAKATGQKFIVDPEVHGKTTIFLPTAVDQPEAFEHLSSALASNGYAISKQGDVMMVRSARRVERDLIEVTTDIPALKPQRIVTYVYTARNMSAADVNRQIRILTSVDGEIVPNAGTNQLIITDWTSNLARIDQVLKQIDKLPDADVVKHIEKETARENLRRQARNKPKGTPHFKED